ncbi:putative RNA 2'-phosphotransferase [Pilimelia terevasa]|uniref:Probable RNA 2'-phosphotransferase n=1 Tax=Pilimelia terevasa TaxID=53372 RepID=A0A8J3BJ74_9ACTN|nr:RNA 2'-phosphotransferase [Pilimelia terevasa]GGK14973.1 putative RNA 2'-phosphotransferase [Pilimelia terevasa]
MDDTRLSKRLSYVLRHAPQTVGLTLGPGGWVDVDALVSAFRAHGVPIDRDRLARVVEGNDKRRFAVDGDRIRASQGHSVAVDLDLPAVAPPPVLHHGTAARHLPSITRDGLVRGRRHHVHLSADPDTARAVGARHGPPVVLRVDAAGMAADGHAFFRSANGVWLTAAVPPRYLGATTGA